MAQAGYTPIQLYYSTTAAAAPVAGNLASGELAINITDGKLYYKDNGGSVQTIASKATSATSGTSILYGNGSGGFSNVTIGSGLSFVGGTLTASGSGGTVTSVGMTVPSFLSVSGSPVTGSGTLAVSYSGTPLPTANGGTGNANGTVNKLATTNFSIYESGGKLYFYYGATAIASMDSSGNFTSLANVTAYGTP